MFKRKELNIGINIIPIRKKITNKIIRAGIDAIDHLINNERIEPKGISKSIILTV